MPLNVKKALLKARGLARKGESDAAARLYSAILEEYPQNKEAAKGLAALGQRPAPAAGPGSFAPREHAEKMLRLFNAGSMQGVIEHGRALLPQYPGDPLLHNLVGTACVSLRQWERAVHSLQEAVRLKPDYAEAHSNLGSALSKLGRHEEAIAAFANAIRSAPGDGDGHYNLGNALRQAGRPHDAIASFRNAIRVAPGHYMAHYNLAGALMMLGDLESAVSAYDSAIAINPDNTDALSNRLVCLSEMDTADAGLQLRLARSYGDLVAAHAGEPFAQWGCDPDAGKLSVGFVSADFRNHPVGYFIEGMLSHMDRDSFELTAYSNATEADDTTARLEGLFDRWRVIADRSDEDAARQVHADAPHILVDLTGHTRAGRLGVFARKAAPVQVTWLGYWSTTGVKQIDYKLGDRFVTPPGAEERFTETLWRLPRAVLCFTPPAEDIAVGPSPALTNGHVTFGCFNTFGKLGAPVIETWAEILRGVPDARLFIKAKALASASVQEQLIQQFADHGVASERLMLEGPSPRREYFEAYHRVDVALDPFPFPGGTTSAEALWMGVPVLTKRGTGLPLSGQGESVLHFSDMADWIATDREDYVARAIALAKDPSPLAELRAGLRERVLASDFFNARQFAADFSEAMREMWQRYRRGE